MHVNDLNWILHIIVCVNMFVDFEHNKVSVKQLLVSVVVVQKWDIKSHKCQILT